MYPILFRLGSHIIYSYTAVLSLGMLAGVWMAYRLARPRLTNPALTLDAGFWGLIGGLVGGRAGYVIANWAYYVDHFGRVFALWQGGLAWHGALWGGCAAIAAWVAIGRRYRGLALDWRDLFDALAPGAALGGAFGWLGCLLTGSAYGVQASGYMPPVAWFAADLPDIYGVSEVRFLTQPLMIAWCLLLWGALLVVGRRLPRGFSFAIYVLGYALGDFGVAFVRGDGTWHFGLALGQWVAIVEMCVAVVMMFRLDIGPGGSCK